MGRAGPSVSLIVVFGVLVLDVVAFALSLAAETRRTKGLAVEDEDGSRHCMYTTDIATGFGAGAFLFLLAGQVLVVSITRCLCCGGALRPGAARIFTILGCLFTWIFFLIAGICQIVGAAHNAIIYNYLASKESTCESLRKGVFAAGAAFTFLHLVFGLAYYIFYAKAADKSWRNINRGEGGGVGMTQYS